MTPPIPIGSTAVIHRPGWPNHGLRVKVMKFDPELYPYHPWLVREISPPDDGNFHSHAPRLEELHTLKLDELIPDETSPNHSAAPAL